MFSIDKDLHGSRHVGQVDRSGSRDRAFSNILGGLSLGKLKSAAELRPDVREGCRLLFVENGGQKPNDVKTVSKPQIRAGVRQSQQVLDLFRYGGAHCFFEFIRRDWLGSEK